MFLRQAKTAADRCLFLKAYWNTVLVSGGIPAGDSVNGDAIVKEIAELQMTNDNLATMLDIAVAKGGYHIANTE